MELGDGAWTRALRKMRGEVEGANVEMVIDLRVKNLS